jgi:hypothetical protein
VAAITFDTAHQREPIRGRLKAALTGLRETLDAFVSYRMRLAAGEAEQVPPRPLRGTSSLSISAQ